MEKFVLDRKIKKKYKKRNYFAKNDHFEHTLASKDRFKPKELYPDSII